MREFGWSIEYTLSLPFPMFLNITAMIQRVRSDAAIDGMYVPYIAAKTGGKASRHLFDARGNFMISETSGATKNNETTVEMVERANKKLQEINQKWQRRLEGVTQM